MVCNCHERVCNKCKHIWLSFNYVSVNTKVQGIWVIVQRNCKVCRMVKWKKHLHNLFYDRPVQEDFSNYLFRLNLLFFISICIDIYICTHTPTHTHTYIYVYIYIYIHIHIYIYIYMYVYMYTYSVIYTGKIYGVNYARKHETILIRFRKILDYYLFLHSFS